MTRRTWVEPPWSDIEREATAARVDAPEPDRQQTIERRQAQEQRMQERSRMRADVEALQSEVAGIKEEQEDQFKAIGEVFGRERRGMRRHVEDAVRDLRRELLREVERLVARVKELEERPPPQPPARERNGDFKFAHEHAAEPVDLPKFLAPVMRKITMN